MFVWLLCCWFIPIIGKILLHSLSSSDWFLECHITRSTRFFICIDTLVWLTNSTYKKMHYFILVDVVGATRNISDRGLCQPWEITRCHIYIIYMLWLYLAISAEYHTDDLLLARRISSALALAILMSRTKPSLYNIYRPIVNTELLVNDSGNNHLELSSNNNKPYLIFRPLPCYRFGLTFAVYAILLPDHYCPASKCFFLNWYDVLYKKPETSIILPSSMTHIPTYIFPQGVHVNVNLISFRYDIIYWYIDIYFDWYLHTPKGKSMTSC